MTLTYISWAPHCSRSDNTARELGGTSHMIYWEQLGSTLLTVWLKYLGQAVRTWRVLQKEKPHAVFVMAPPVFAAVAVLPYCRLHGATLVVDAHTGAFFNRRWRYVQWLQRWICRRASTTIVTNDHLRELVEAHGGHATIVPDVPVVFPAGASYPLAGDANIAVVCSFGIDEPLDAMIGAARRLPHVRFHVTGNPKDLDPALARQFPDNMRLTGFLSLGAYGSLLTNADAVMTLTTKDHTMLRGAWEAVYVETPVIVSDWPTLRDSFDQGAVHVDNTAEGIQTGVQRMLDGLDSHRRGVAALRQQKVRRWESTKRDLLDRLTRA